MEKNFYYYKYNEDDILEILTEYLASKSEIKSFNAKAVLLGIYASNIYFGLFSVHYIRNVGS